MHIEPKEEKLITNYLHNLIFGMIDSEKNNNIKNLKDYEKYAIGKTANLFGFSIVLGLVSDNQEVEKEVAIEYFDFGVKFGLLFQKIDDYLDCFKKDEIGKNGFDEVNEIKNFITITNLSKEEARILLLNELEELEKSHMSVYVSEQINLLKGSINE